MASDRLLADLQAITDWHENQRHSKDVFESFQPGTCYRCLRRTLVGRYRGVCEACLFEHDMRAQSEEKSRLEALKKAAMLI